MNRTTTMLQYGDGEGRVRNEPGVSSSEPVKTAVKLMIAGSPTGVANPPIAGGRGGRGRRGNTAPGPNSDTMADLGMVTLNGVQASGTSHTAIVPVGAIGNDREFRSVSEHWFSPD